MFLPNSLRQLVVGNNGEVSSQFQTENHTDQHLDLSGRFTPLRAAGRWFYRSPGTSTRNNSPPPEIREIDNAGMCTRVGEKYEKN